MNIWYVSSDGDMEKITFIGDIKEKEEDPEAPPEEKGMIGLASQMLILIPEIVYDSV